MSNDNLHGAKNKKQDEFYTQYCDIEAEMNAYVEYNPDVFRDKTILLPCDDPVWSNFTRYFASNFERFGLKKLISTSYAFSVGNRHTTVCEYKSPNYDKSKQHTHGKLFMVDGDADDSGNVDLSDVVFKGYLEGDGDFRSVEVTALRDEADIIITNPPFSLFREFLEWIMEGKKQFIIIGNQNAISYKEVFPLLKENQIWLGYNEGGSRKGNSMFFIVPDDYENDYVEFSEGARLMQTTGKWFTNIEHGKRHKELQLMTLEQNLKFNKKLRRKLEKEGCTEYPHYDNYNAIEIPYSECVPSDYDGVMGVPITFLDKHCPEQFEILDARDFTDIERLKSKSTMLVKDADSAINGKPKYARILIRHRHPKEPKHQFTIES